MGKWEGNTCEGKYIFHSMEQRPCGGSSKPTVICSWTQCFHRYFGYSVRDVSVGSGTQLPGCVSHSATCKLHSPGKPANLPGTHCASAVKWGNHSTSLVLRVS